MTPSVLPLGAGMTADRVKNFSLLQNAYPTVYSMITGGYYTRSKAAGAWSQPLFYVY
jgi:hypothetical protein